MKKQEELFRELSNLMKETKEGKIHWIVEMQTTEYNAPADKPVEEEDGKSGRWMNVTSLFTVSTGERNFV